MFVPVIRMMQKIKYLKPDLCGGTESVTVPLGLV